jgi:ADP-heptose:LPS heptosyltransferase/glycosyltransferase involved in cell wall biosynthesis
MPTKLRQCGRCGKGGFPQQTTTFHVNFGDVLSVVVIAKNESQNLPRCLASVAGVADDVVVVDSGSTDGTPQLAQAQGARVFQREFTTYADQKNWAADQASEPYVLSLDADEALSPELRAEILAWKGAFESGLEGTHLEAWSMPRLTEYCGTWVRHGGWYPDRKIRLWAAGSGRWCTPVEGSILHEAWVPEAGVAVREFRGDLLHYSYHTTSDHHRQWAKFSTLGARDAVAAGRRSSFWKPRLRYVFQGFKQLLLQGGWRDGRAGWEVARWSALSAYWKWRQVAASDELGGLRSVGVVRSDALGDTVVSLPMAGALKRALPEAKLVWVCREYARPVVERSREVDEVRVWDGKKDAARNEALFAGLDAVVFACPEPELMAAAARAGVPVRVATGRRWVSVRWATRRVWRSRKNRPEHEAMQGLRLLHALAIPARWRHPELQDWQALTGLQGSINSTRVNNLVPSDWGPIQGSVVLHPGNHGSANSWSAKRFAEVASRLLERGVPVVVTGTASERPGLMPVLEALQGHPAALDAVGRWNLSELTDVLGSVGCVVASSTGPLHVASALGTPTVGLYRSVAPFWPERWGPLGGGQVLATESLAEGGGLDLEVSAVESAVLRVLSGEVA